MPRGGRRSGGGCALWVGVPLTIYARIRPATLSAGSRVTEGMGGEDPCGRRSFVVSASGGSSVPINSFACHPTTRDMHSPLPGPVAGFLRFSEKFGKYLAWRRFPTSTGPQIYKKLERARAPHLELVREKRTDLGGKSAPTRAEKAHVRKKRANSCGKAAST